MSEQEKETKKEDIDFTAEQLDQLETMLQEVVEGVFEKGLTPAQILDISKEETDALYALGHNKYQDGDYEAAQEIFNMLCRLSPLEPDYMRALGSTLQLLKRYEDALAAYGAVISVDLDDADASLHAGECLLHLGRRDQAKQALEGCQIQAKENSEKYAETLEKADSLLAKIAEIDEPE